MPLTDTGAARQGQKVIRIHVDREFDYSLYMYSDPIPGAVPGKFTDTGDAGVKITSMKERNLDIYSGHKVHFQFKCDYKGWRPDWLPSSANPTPIGVTVEFTFKLMKHEKVTLAGTDSLTFRRDLVMGHNEWRSGALGWDGPTKTVDLYAKDFADGRRYDARLNEKDFGDPDVQDDVIKKTYWKIEKVVVVYARSAYGNGAEKTIDINQENINVNVSEATRWHPGVEISLDSAAPPVSRTTMMDRLKECFKMSLKFDFNAGRAAQLLAQEPLKSAIKSQESWRTAASAVANFAQGALVNWFVPSPDQLVAKMTSSDTVQLSEQREATALEVKTELQTVGGRWDQWQTAKQQTTSAQNTLNQAVEALSAARASGDADAIAAADAVRAQALSARDVAARNEQLRKTDFDGAVTEAKDAIARNKAKNRQLSLSIGTDPTGLLFNANIAKWTWSTPKFRFVVPVLTIPGYLKFFAGIGARGMAKFKLFPSDEEIAAQQGLPQGAWAFLAVQSGDLQKRTWECGWDAAATGIAVEFEFGAEVGVSAGIVDLGAEGKGVVTAEVKLQDLSKIKLGGSFTVSGKASVNLFWFWSVEFTIEVYKLIPPTVEWDFEGMVGGMSEGASNWQHIFLGKEWNAV